VFQKNYIGCFRRGFFYNFILIFFFLGVPFGTAVTGILDMRPGKHDLHFLVGVELLPHAVVNIPNETFHIGVFIYFYYLFYSFYFYVVL
jgi:hypothetical protein